MNDTPDKQAVEAKLSEIKSLIQKGDLQKAWAGCRDILAFDPGNEFVQKLKSEIERTGKIMETGRTDEIDVKALRCPSCRSPLNITQQSSETATCNSCGSVLDLTEGELAVLGKVDPGKFAPESFIKLGKIGNIRGKKYQVIGRICFSSRIREWDPEDNCYYTEPWNFDEWILVGENKEYLFIGEDLEGYSMSQPFTPTAPKIPEQGASFMTLSKEGSPRRILEDSTSKIEFFEGEFTWLPKVGETIRSAEYEDVGTRYSVEWRLGEGEKIEEVEFFSSQRSTKMELAAAFGEEEIIAEEQRKLEAEEEYRKWSWAFFAAAAVCLLLLIGSCSRSGKMIFDSGKKSLSAIPQEGLIVGPFQLKKKNSVHKIVLTSNMRDNTSSWGAIELLDSQQASINAVEGDFWRESGYDSDGRWSEQDTKREYYFRLDTPGVFYARMFAEKGTATGGALQLRVYQGLGLSRYYVIGLLFCLGFGFAISRYKTLNPLYVVVGIFALGILILSHMGSDD